MWALFEIARSPRAAPRKVKVSVEKGGGLLHHPSPPSYLSHATCHRSSRGSLTSSLFFLRRCGMKRTKSPNGNPPNQAQPRGAQVSPHLLLMLGEVRGMTKPPPSQLCTSRETPNEPGIFKDVQFYPILNFGHFWAPLFSRCFYPIMNFVHFGASLALDLPQCQEPWRWERRRRARKNCQERRIKETKKTTQDKQK